MNEKFSDQPKQSESKLTESDALPHSAGKNSCLYLLKHGQWWQPLQYREREEHSKRGIYVN